MEPQAVFYGSAALREQAAALATRHKLRLVDISAVDGARQRLQLEFFKQAVGAEDFFAFVWSEAGLALMQVESGRMVTIQADFADPSVDYRRRHGGGRGEAIARAVGLRGQEPLSVVDATTGLGGDAFILAALGCRMTLLERVPALQDLLANGLARGAEVGASSDPELGAAIARMTLVRGDAVDYLRALPSEESPDVIYLDPMFPERRKSAAVKKEMQLFHRLVGADADAGALLGVALTRARQRVVVKRPRLADPLEGPPPDHLLEGVRNRYDLYVTAGRPGAV